MYFYLSKVIVGFFAVRYVLNRFVQPMLFHGYTKPNHTPNSYAQPRLFHGYTKPNSYICSFGCFVIRLVSNVSAKEIIQRNIGLFLNPMISSDSLIIKRNLDCPIQRS